LRSIITLLFSLALFFLAASGRAQEHPAGTKSAGSIELTAPGGGPLALLIGKEGSYVGEFTITNTGADPLVVSRIAPRGDEEDVRIPSRLSARFTEGGGTTATIPPKASRKVLVTWIPEHESRMKQLFGHVIVTSTDEPAGEVAMGVTAQIPRGLGFISEHALSLLIFLPLLGALGIFGLRYAGYTDDKPLRWVGLGVTGAQLLLALWVFQNFNGDVTRADGNDGFQFIEHAVWVRSLHIEYFVGVDGTSIMMVLLTALLAFVGAVASFTIDKRLKAYVALYLLLTSAMMGVFVTLDLVLFFAFWEGMLLPIYFLIAIWGGPKREYAAVKYFIYTHAGSILMLLAIIALSNNADRTFLVDGSTATHSFSVPELMRVSYNAKHLTIFGLSFVKVVWVALFVAFAIKLPMFPFHTWLPDALTEAPTPVSILLAGVGLKMGAYGILRVSFGILPDASRWAAGAMVAFGTVSIIYAALCAMAQTDLKRLVAYGTVSQMGFCLVGLGSMTPQGISACLLQMFSHGIIVAMLLLLVGAIQERAHTREIEKLGGLASEMPLYTLFFGFAFMASLGLPGLSGFWGTALAIVGAFPSYRVLACIAATGALLSAAYHLSAVQRVCLGPFKESWRKSAFLEPFGGKFPELTVREMASLAPLVALCLGLGLWPVPLLSAVSGGVRDVTSLVNPAGPDQIALLERP
jgi:NADH-quinone oxidoreductase subunit M